MNDYFTHQSEYIVKNHSDIMIDIDVAHRLFKELFPDKDSTWTYNLYNVFSLTACSTHFYNIYKELRDVIRSRLGETRPLWIQSWINYLRYEELNLLDWHGHNFEYHGYISIEPKKTNTVFENYSIENKVGQIYFGPGERIHKVEAIESYIGERITLGFDIVTIPEQSFVTYIERPWKNMSFIPLL